MSKNTLEPEDHMIDTALVPDDDDPMMTEDGYTAVTPRFDDDQMLEALEDPDPTEAQAELPPQEAYELMQYEAPLSKDERDVLNETPFLQPPGGLSWVDDPDHEEWLFQKQKEKSKAMDEILEDEMYGDDVGLSLKRLGRGIARGARRATKPLTSLVKKFVPGRDAQKAALVKQTYARLVAGRANFLQISDVRARRPSRPRSYYEAQSKPWAKSKLVAGGLPVSTSTTMGEVAVQILGADVMGSWWNPFSWFATRTKYVVQNAQGEMAEMSPAEFNAWQAAQGMQAQSDPSSQQADPNIDPGAAADPSQSFDPSQDPSQYGDPSMSDQSGISDDMDLVFGDTSGLREDEAAVNGEQTHDYDMVVGGRRRLPSPIQPRRRVKSSGDDSFAGFADEILGTPARTITPNDYRKLTLAKAQRMSGVASPPRAAMQAAHAKLSKELPAKNIKVARPADVTGAWLYRLDPSYWMKSPRERHLIDAEKKNWEKTQSIAKRNAKHSGELEAGKRALYQAEQARAAEAESQAMESQLKDIEESVSSGVSSSGGDSILGAAAEGRRAASKNASVCSALAAKVEAGQKLSPDELANLRQCLKMCGHLRKLHEVLHAKTTGTPTTSSGYHDDKPVKSDFLGENVIEIVGGASGGHTRSQWVALTAVAASQPGKLAAFARQQGIKLTASDMQRLKGAVARTKQIMSHPAYKQVKLNRAALSGMGSDSMGFSWSKVLTAPLALAAVPAAGLSWGMTKIVQAPTKMIQWGARKGGWQTPGTGYRAPGQPGAQPGAPGAAGPSPATLAAAKQRRLAALARAQAAAATTAAAQQELQAQAAAADAEAQAMEAEAQAQQAQTDAENAQFDVQPSDGGTTDESGASWNESGRVSVLGAEVFTGAFVGEVDDPKAKKVVEEASKDTPAGKKVRAGATLYHKARKGDPKSRLAIRKIAAKAATGDKQAKIDADSVRAGKIALHAKARAHKKLAAKAAREARNQRGIARQRRMEAWAATRLAQGTRKRHLAQAAKVERRAAHGDKHAKKVMAHVVKKAKGGDKKAQSSVEAMRLARHVRTSSRTPSEAKRIKAAGKVVAHAHKGNKKALRQIALINAAAKSGQPNAKRAQHRLKVAASLHRAITTGKVTAPPVTKKQLNDKQLDANRLALKKYEFIKGRVSSGVATKEEAIAGAKLASSLSKATAEPAAKQTLEQEAAELAIRARALRSGTQPIKDTALVAAAAEKGDKEAQATIQDALAAAQSGDPRGISAAGHLAAAQTVGTLQKGGTMSPEVAEAMGIVERAHAGDPEAKRTVARAGAAAQDPSHPNHDQAVGAAVALTAAAALTAATAARPGAQKTLRDAARKARGQEILPEDMKKSAAELDRLTAKVKDGTATRGEAERARNLAMALGKTSLAAQISALMPPDDLDAPLSSLPTPAEEPIKGFFGLLKASLQALLLATPDPFGNYHEGVRDRGATPLIGPMRAATAGDDELAKLKDEEASLTNRDIERDKKWLRGTVLGKKLKALNDASKAGQLDPAGLARLAALAREVGKNMRSSEGKAEVLQIAQRAESQATSARNQI